MPRLGCARISATITPNTTSSGSSVWRTLAMRSSRRDSSEAANSTSASFAASEGWITRPPTRIQRAEPLPTSTSG